MQGKGRRVGSGGKKKSAISQHQQCGWSQGTNDLSCMHRGLLNVLALVRSSLGGEGRVLWGVKDGKRDWGRVGGGNVNSVEENGF